MCMLQHFLFQMMMIAPSGPATMFKKSTDYLNVVMYIVYVYVYVLEI